MAHTLSSQAGKSFDPEDGALLGSKKQTAIYQAPSAEEQARIREAIKNATTLGEISHLERQLAGGLIPGR